MPTRARSLVAAVLAAAATATTVAVVPGDAARPCQPRKGCVTTDTVAPVPAVLAAAPGDARVDLSWTAATDNVGVARYEVWRDNAWVTQLGATARSYAVTGLTNGVTSSYRVVAYDAAGNYANSNTVTATPETSVSPPPPPPPDAFPSRLAASGRVLVDEAGRVQPVLRGFNMHVSPSFVWDQGTFDEVARVGARINRAVLVWDELEPSRGQVSAAGIANLDAHIARAQAAGMYTLLELHLNVGRTPSWTHDKATELEQYAAYGQYLTQYLANRYGNPASPKFTKAVVGFGLNEPPLEDSTIRNGNSSIPYLEAKQRQMIAWFREPGFAPAWIGFVAYGYASQTPIYNDAIQNSLAADADPHAFDSVGGNVVLDLHDYDAGCTNDDPACDGRQWNGQIYVTTQGGPLIYSQQSRGYISTSTTRSQLAAYVAPYRTFTAAAGIPLALAEWGWPAGVSGEDAWTTDQLATWRDAGTVMEIWWNYGTSTSQGVWVARPGGVWRPSLLRWLAGS